MAQSRQRRKQRVKKRTPTPTGPSPLEQKRTRRTRAIVVAFFLILGLAGVLALAPGDDPNGAPAPPAAGETRR